MVKNARNLLGILTKYANEIYWDKCLISHWEYFPMWIMRMLCQIPSRFPSVWSDTGNGEKLLGNSRIMQMRCSGTKCLIKHRGYILGMLGKIPTMSPSISQCMWSDTGNTFPNIGILGKIHSFIDMIVKYKIKTYLHDNSFHPNNIFHPWCLRSWLCPICGPRIKALV